MEKQPAKMYYPAFLRFHSYTADDHLDDATEQLRIRGLTKFKSTAVFTPALTHIQESKGTEEQSYYSYKNEFHRKISSVIARYGVQVCMEFVAT